MSKQVQDVKDPKKGASRIVATAVATKKTPAKLRELLDTIARHKPITGILNDIDRICKAKGVDRIMLLVKVDKSRAMEIFQRNISNNREIKWWKAEHHATAMKLGKWDYNGPKMNFTSDGHLMDCQHRLLAIILSDTVQTFHLEGGFPPENIRSIDTGTVRSAKDLLKMKGILTHPETMAAAIKNIIQFNKFGRIYGNVHGTKVDNMAVNDFIESTTENIKQLASYCELGIKQYHHENPYFSQSQWGFLYYILARTKGRRDAADLFITALTSGKQITDRGPTGPIYHCMRLLRSWDKSKFAGMKPGHQLTLKIKYVIEYWNCYVTGDKGRIDPQRGLILSKEDIASLTINRPL